MYAKIFTQLWEGSMRGHSDLILVFINLLCHCDEEGVVDRHWRAIVDETGLPENRVKAAISGLESPDPESRTADNEGRRIARLQDHRDWGWIILNHKHYRDLKTNFDRKEYMKNYMLNWRKQKKTKVNSLSESVSVSASGIQEGDSKGEETPEAVSDKAWQEIKDLPGLNISREVWLRLKQSFPHAHTCECARQCALAWIAGGMDKQHFYNKLRKMMSDSDKDRYHRKDMGMEVCPDE